MYRPRRTAPCRSSTRTAPCTEKPLWRQDRRFSTTSLGDQLLAEEHSQHLGAKEPLDMLPQLPPQPPEFARRPGRRCRNRGCGGLPVRRNHADSRGWEGNGPHRHGGSARSGGREPGRARCARDGARDRPGHSKPMRPSPRRGSRIRRARPRCSSQPSRSRLTAYRISFR